MGYIENPKFKGSGILGAIPQKGECPNKCEECFFQAGRCGYLEPLEENLPNMPTIQEARGCVVRVNDGNDSNHRRELVVAATMVYQDKFYNTARPIDLGGFPAPVVLTVNRGEMTDVKAYKLDAPPPNLMFVRFLVNMWNLDLCSQVVEHYSERKVPIVLTFMRYYSNKIPAEFRHYYEYKRHIQNSYWKITFPGWQAIMRRYEGSVLVYSCGTEGVDEGFLCRHCGNCLREYFATMERMRKR